MISREASCQKGDQETAWSATSGFTTPSSTFRNEGWLKLTALYWDSLRRIVPSGASVHDTDQVKRLVDDGFIQNKKPHGAALQISYPFRELIAAHGHTLRTQFAVAKRDSWPDDPHTQLYCILPAATLSLLTSLTRRWITNS
jgi:hypothetical protein